MMKPSDRVREALAAAGATLKRAKKHLVYVLPNGRTVVLSQTPSDVRAEQNKLRDIRHATGEVSSAPKQEQPPRVRAVKPGRREADWLEIRTPMATALRSTGLVEQQLRDQIRKLEADIRVVRWRAETAEQTIGELEALPVVRYWRRWQRVWARIAAGRR